MVNWREKVVISELHMKQLRKYGKLRNLLGDEIIKKKKEREIVLNLKKT